MSNLYGVPTLFRIYFLLSVGLYLSGNKGFSVSAFILEVDDESDGEAELHRVWVKYEEGQHDACLHSIQNLMAMASTMAEDPSGAAARPTMKMHYDFEPLDSVVL